VFILSSVWTIKIYAQLGFCAGNSGDPIFVETFGSGITNNPLPAGTTTYPFSPGYPNDGFYTVSNGTIGNSFDWHQTQAQTHRSIPNAIYPLKQESIRNRGVF